MNARRIAPPVLLLVLALSAGCASAKGGAAAAEPGKGPSAVATAAGDGTASPAAAPAAVPAPPPEPSMTPEEFLRYVDADCRLQVELARREVANGSMPKVKSYAERVATNHAAIEAIVRKVAKASNLSLDGSPAPGAEAAAARMKDLGGEALDKAYAMYMAESQPAVLAAYRWQYDNCKDEAVRAFAMQTMPIVGVHQRIGDELHKDVNREEIRLAAEKKAAEEKAAEEKRIADAMAAAQKNAKKQPPQRKSMLRAKPVPKEEPEEEAAPEAAKDGTAAKPG